MFFDSWEDMLRVLAVGILAYAGLILLLRISGKRTLSKMNAFDLVVTVALGSVLATILLSRDVSLLEGLLAFAVLIGLQYTITLTSTRWRITARLIKSEPRLLFFKGHFLQKAMNEERILESEIQQAIRSSGTASLDDIEAVVLETDGSFSTISKGQKEYSALTGIPLPEREEKTGTLS